MSGPNRTASEAFADMDTEALRSLLMLEMDAEGEIDLARVQSITDILAQREHIEVPDVDADWETFQDNFSSAEPLYTPEQEAPKAVRASGLKALRRGAFLAALVAVMIIGATLTAQATEFDLWGAVAKWTSETFRFVYDQFGDEDQEKAVAIDPSLQPLWDAMQDCGVEHPLLPTVLPEGYVQADFMVEPAMGLVMGTYQRGEEQLIQLQIHLDAQNNVVVEKNDTTPDVYVWNETEFYIVTNYGQSVATWTSGLCVYMMFASTETELYQMIESIPGEGT